MFASAVMAAISGAPALVPPTGNQGMPLGQPEAVEVHSMMYPVLGLASSAMSGTCRQKPAGLPHLVPLS